MLGSSLWFIPGIFVLALGVTLQAGATGAVRAIKMSATLTTARRPGPPGHRAILNGLMIARFGDELVDTDRVKGCDCGAALRAACSAREFLVRP